MSWAAEESKRLGREVFHTIDRETLVKHISESFTVDDVIAFKGGQQMALSIVIDELYGTSLILLDGDVLRKRGKKAIRDSVEYRMIEGYGVELRRPTPDFSASQIVVRSMVNAKPVHLVGKLAFWKSEITALAVPEPVRTIGLSAFFQARRLRQVILPRSLRLIERSAFNGCVRLHNVEVPNGVTTIRRRAFYGCRRMVRIVVPESVITIESEIFTGCPELTVVCVEGSAVDNYLKENYPQMQKEYM